MPKSNDPEKQATYNAEWDLRSLYEMMETVDDYSYDFHGCTMQLPRERKFARIEDIERYYHAVCSLSQVRAKFPGLKPPTVVRRRGQTEAHYEFIGNRVAIPDKLRWALREIVALHELAHACAPGARHGQAFRHAYLFLVGEAMGGEVKLLLLENFDKNLACV